MFQGYLIYRHNDSIFFFPLSASVTHFLFVRPLEFRAACLHNIITHLHVSIIVCDECGRRGHASRCADASASPGVCKGAYVDARTTGAGNDEKIDVVANGVKETALLFTPPYGRHCHNLAKIGDDLGLPHLPPDSNQRSRTRLRESST